MSDVLQTRMREEGGIIELTLDLRGEHYVFCFTEEYRRAMLEVLGRFANNPDLNLNWHDAEAIAADIEIPKAEPIEKILRRRAGFTSYGY